MMAKYGGQNEYLVSDNSRRSFEWILLQWPPSGISPAYNARFTDTPFDVMVLGASIFRDGRYKWLAERMLSIEIGNSESRHGPIIGLSYWDDEIVSVKPSTSSDYIKGSGGIAQKPSPLLPDKIVFRDGWDQGSLYALLNLRFSGWHSYKASNSFVLITYGKPFVVEEVYFTHYPWLPEAIADYRDKKIDRIQLNGFQIEAEGLEREIYAITGVGSRWSQDPPRFANVFFFYQMPMTVFSKTAILNWHGWNHYRISILLEKECLVVFDYAKGDHPRTVAITWNLKGYAQQEDQRIRLTQGNYSLVVSYPHADDWYIPQISPVERTDQFAGDIHRPDINLYMLSNDKAEVGFMTMFRPDETDRYFQASRIEVTSDWKESAYPLALGLQIVKPAEVKIIGANFGTGPFVYKDVRTDAEVFVFRKETNSWNVVFKNSRFFEVASDRKPLYIKLNGQYLGERSDWLYNHGLVTIRLRQNEGILEIGFLNAYEPLSQLLEPQPAGEQPVVNLQGLSLLQTVSLRKKLSMEA